jgi:hypothetical protein
MLVIVAVPGSLGCTPRAWEVLSGCSLFGSDTGQGPQTVTAVDRWRPLQTAAWGMAGARAGRDERGSSPRLWRQLDCRATGMLREHLPRRQPTEASPRPVRCEDEMQSLDPVRLVRNYALCMIYPLFRRRYDRAVVGRTKKVPMKRFTVVAAGVASLLLFSSPNSRRSTARPESASRPASPPPASTAARTPPPTGSSSDLDLVRSNGEGSYGGLLPFMRFSSRQ